MKRFAPDDVEIPQGFATTGYCLRPLTIHDVVKDYDAVMSSRQRLQGLFGPHDPWPADDLSLEQDLIDLGWHQGEFQRRRSFAYTVMRPDESQCLGCAYVEPSSREGYDAQLFFWVRDSESHRGLEAALERDLESWLSREWWFDRVAWPGRRISWADWFELPEA